MQHCGTKTIKTGRLVLRPLSFEDTAMMFANWASDPAITRYLRWDTHRNWTATAEYLNEVAKQYARPDFYDWGICTHTGVLIGNISIAPAEKDAAGGWKKGLKVELLGPAWEVGYVIGRKWWSQGYATEALCAVRDFWFGKVDAPWLVAFHANPNIASAAVLQKAGFVYDHDVTCHRFDGTPVPCRAYFHTR